MALLTPVIPTTAADYEKMTRPQKLAALLIMLGQDGAAQVLKNLDEQEIEAVSAEMPKLTILSQEIQNEILKEFTGVAVQAATSLLGGIDYTQGTLEKALGLFKASNIVSRTSPTRAPVSAMKQIADLDARQIFNLIKLEQPQTITLVVSYLASEKAAQLLTMLRPELRQDVIERLATLAPTPVEVVEKVIEVLNRKLGSRGTRALNQTGGLKSAASLLNALDKNLSKSLILSIEERNHDLGQAIRQKMFTFEDILNLEPQAIQKILREVDMRDLAVSLKTASEQLKELLLSSISKRAAESVKEEMSYMGPLKMREIEAAQLRIIDVLRRLEAAGEIETGNSEEIPHETMA
jgi:flagellar motor switch protein FliG